MDLNTLGEDIDNLDPKQRKSILNLIQAQSQQDMKEVVTEVKGVVTELSKLRHEWATNQNALKNEWTTSQNALENKVTTSQSALENKMTTGHNALKSELSSKLTTVYWVIGSVGATIATLLTVLGLVALLK